MKKIIYIILSIALLSCNNDFESVFKEDPDTRARKANKELKDLLCSAENGWKCCYVYDKIFPLLVLSSYQVYEFNEDLTFKVKTTDVPEGEESEYFIFHEATTELKFTTWNDNLTIYANPGSMFPEGLGQELEFYLKSSSENKVVFEGKVFGNELVFERASEEDLNFTEINNYFNLFAKFLRYNYTTVLVESGINGASEDNPIAISMNFSNSIFSAEIQVPQKDGTTLEYPTSLAFTTNGILLSYPIVIDGRIIDSFTFDAESEQFVINNPGVKGKLVNTKFPYFAEEGVLDELFVNKHTFKMYQNSEYSQDQCEEFNNILSALTEYKPYPSFYFSRMAYVTNYIDVDGKELGDGFIFFRSGTKEDLYAFLPVSLKKEIKADRGIFETGDVVSNIEDNKGIEYLESIPEYQDLIDMINDEGGFYITREEFSYGIELTLRKMSDTDYFFTMNDFKF